jgi:hypothetical protein
MIGKLDWAAAIVPGKSLMGLILGTSQSDVMASFLAHSLDPSNPTLIKFQNSPVLLVDSDKAGVIILRAAELKGINYAWQNEVASLIFDDSKLVNIIVTSVWGGEEIQYQGKLFNDIGLNSLVSDLLNFCELEYDSADECFYPSGEIAGLIVAGPGSCELSVDPKQIISFIRIFE